MPSVLKVPRTRYSLRGVGDPRADSSSSSPGDLSWESSPEFRVGFRVQVPRGLFDLCERFQCVNWDSVSVQGSVEQNFVKLSNSLFSFVSILLSVI